MTYLKTFLISAPVFALFYHWISVEAMPWWPDTAIMGAFMGALAAFVLMRFPVAGMAAGHVWRASKSAVRLVRRS